MSRYTDTDADAPALITDAQFKRRYRQGERKFSGMIIRSKDGGPADLSVLDMPGVDFSGTDLEGANLSGSNLERANLRGANLRHANLTEIYLRQADLTEANMEGGQLYQADLRHAILESAGLDGANMRGAQLQKARLLRANLWGASLFNAQLSGTDLRDADLRDAQFSVYAKTDFGRIPREDAPTNIDGAIWADESYPVKVDNFDNATIWVEEDKWGRGRTEQLLETLHVMRLVNGDPRDKIAGYFSDAVAQRKQRYTEAAQDITTQGTIST